MLIFGKSLFPIPGGFLAFLVHLLGDPNSWSDSG